MNKVAKDVAALEIDRFMEAMDIVIDDDLDADSAAAYNRARSRMVRAVTLGSLVIDDNGEAIYTPKHPNSRSKEPIRFHERSGSTAVAMDSCKKGANTARMYAMLGDMCKVPPATFSGLVGPDIKMCEAIFALLMD